MGVRFTHTRRRKKRILKKSWGVAGYTSTKPFPHSHGHCWKMVALRGEKTFQVELWVGRIFASSPLRLFLVHVPTRHCPLARVPGGKWLEIRSRERSRAQGRVSTGVISQRRGASFGASGPTDTGPGAWSQGTAWATACQPRWWLDTVD